MAVRTRDILIETAEELFARHGIAAVSLRQIGAAAGQRNTSAVLYHFGSKQALVDAIFALRMSEANVGRQQMLETLEREGSEDDLRGLIQALVVPFVEIAARHPNYARFLSQVYVDPSFRRNSRLQLEEHAPYRGVMSHVHHSLHELPPVVRKRRILMVGSLLRYAVSRYTKEFERVPPGALATELIDAIVGLLTAPCSRKRRRPRARRGS